MDNDLGVIVLLAFFALILVAWTFFALKPDEPTGGQRRLEATGNARLSNSMPPIDANGGGDRQRRNRLNWDVFRPWRRATNGNSDAQAQGVRGLQGIELRTMPRGAVSPRS